MALVDHYQKTYELVLHFWERRNRQFLVLMGLLAAAALVTIFQESLFAFVRLQPIWRYKNPPTVS